MKSMLKKTTLREIRGSLGRYMAILAIVALGVGFFAGLKEAKPFMVETGNRYLQEQNLFDLRLISTLGLVQEDIDAFGLEEGVEAAEGSYSYDILCTGIGENETVVKAHSLTEGINGVVLTAGRMPENAGECVADSRLVGEEQIGEVITLSDANEEDTLAVFREKELTIVGTVDASYYINFERGTTSLGNGRVSGYIYLLPEAFDSDYYTEAFVKFEQDYDIYSDAYEDFIDELTDHWEAILEQRATLRYQDILQEANETLTEAKEELAGQEAEAREELADARQTLVDAEEELANGKTEIADGWDTLREQEASLKEQEEQLNSQESLLEEQQTQLAGQEQLLASQGLSEEMIARQLSAAREQLAAAQEQLAEGRNQITLGKSALAEAKEELTGSEEEVTEAEKDLAEGWQSYEEAEAEFDEKIADAEKELAEAEEEINQIKKPDCYVLGRDTNTGYVCFDNDSSIVEGIGNVFPIFFFLVAALVCVTTMNRMVEEQRTQIGVLKALGYTKAAIMSKYLFYSGSAALIGCILGYLGGTWLFPKVIWVAYGIMYTMPGLVYQFDLRLALICLLVSLLCSMGATWFSCRYELSETAAGLMRPKSPKAGRRILLEKLPFFWKRLKFLQKVSVRNIFRYKKRFFMMIIGISGCCALLLTGFGLRDSVAELAEQQFEEVQISEGSITLKAESSGKGEDDTVEESTGQGDVGEDDTGEEEALTTMLAAYTADYTFACEESWDLLWGSGSKALNLVVMEQPEDAGNYMNFHTVKGEALSYPGKGEALISHKIADTCGIRTGDQITIRNADMEEMTVTVSGIFENFVYNYIYLAGETYEEGLGRAPEYQTIYVNFKEEQDIHQAAAAFMNLEEVSAVTVNQDTKDRISQMMGSLNYVVLLVILCAAGLAFIVLYNLTNINITERIREVATIKVLGFYRKETAAYVFRENWILTAIGIGLGLILGHYLHSFVMAQVNVDMVAFDVHINPESFLYSIVLTFLFNFLVNRVMSLKLEKINMAESLKSVE